MGYSSTALKAVQTGIELAIPHEMSTPEWAETYRVVDRGARKGRWSNETVPFATEIMAAADDPMVREIVFMKPSQVAGPLALDTEIPTVDGWTTMAEIDVGDRVFDENGQPCEVVGVSSIFNDRCFEVEFSDRSKIVCDERHLWTVDDHKDTSKTIRRTITATELAATFRDVRWTRNRYSIPVCQPLEINAGDLPLDPYLLGAWLGDGHASSNQITQNREDAVEMAAQIEAGGNVVQVRTLPGAKGNVVNLFINPRDNSHCPRGHEKTAKNVGPLGQCRKCASQNTLHYRNGRVRDPYVERPKSGYAQFQALDLIRNKHIPMAYLRASRADRLSLLQGLMDTDGTIDHRGRCSLTIVHDRLAMDAYELLMTLGIKCSIYISLSARGFSGGPRQSAPVNLYCLSFMVYEDKPVFRLARKRAKMASRQGRRTTETESRRIVAVREVPSVSTRCIAVNSESHLFLAGRSMIATHNTEITNNIIGKRIHLAPTEIIYCAEKEDKAKAWTQESFDSMVRATPELKAAIGTSAQDNNQNVKRFPGGGLYIVWATSPAELSSRPAQIIVFDEKAAYRPTNEGDAVKLGEARTKTYDGEELIVKISTPRRCDCSVGETCGDISHDYDRGDSREYYVPCPHCDEFQTLKFGGKDAPFGLKWEPDAPEMPFYLCEHCQAMIEEFDRDDMLAKGYWRAAKPFTGVASFKINQIYSPFVSWGRMVVDFLEAKRSIAKLEVYTNTVLGETWKPVEQIEYEDLTWNLEAYPAAVPAGVLVLTAGVDVQKDRIECEVVGWGRDHESWSIDYKVFMGSPGIEITEDEGSDDIEPLSSVWNDLAEYLQSSFTGEGGQAFRIQCVGIDSGYLATIVYKFCKKYAAKRWFAVKGMSDPFKPLLSKPTLSGRNPKVRLFPVGTNAAKDDIFAALRVLKPGPAYCHFPDRQPYNEDAHMKQLCAERMVTHTRGGRTYRVYEPVAKGVRNEALDVRVYATAARVILNPNYEAIARRRLEHAEAADRSEPPASAGGQEVAPKPAPAAANVVMFNRRRRVKSLNDPFR